ncbi:Disease resistance protein L6 [Linum perenne]
MSGMKNVNIQELYIEELRKLKTLVLAGCNIRMITGGTFGMLKKLQELDLNYLNCMNLREVVVDVGKLPSLKILRTGGAKEVEYELPVGLKELTTSSWILNLVELLELEVLDVQACKDGLDIPPNSEENQGTVWCKVSKLKTLALTETKINSNVVDVTLGVRVPHVLLPASLTSLRIRYCQKSTWIPSLENLENLTVLEVIEVNYQTPFGSGDLDGLEGLRSLQTLTIVRVDSLTRIKGLRDLLCSSTCKLQSLEICGCPDLIELLPRELDDDRTIVPSLQHIHIRVCPQLEIGPMIRGLSKFPMLKHLILEHVKFTSISNNSKEDELGSLEELVYLGLMLYTSSLERIASLSKLQKLLKLEVHVSSLREIQGLEELKSLQVLDLKGCESLERLWPADHVQQLCSLEELDIRNCKSLSVEHLVAVKTSLPNVDIIEDKDTQFVHIIKLPSVHLQQKILKMSYIRGVATMAALVLPLVLLYKLWYGRRSSDGSNNNNNDNGHTDSTFMVDQSSIAPDSADPSSSLHFPSVEYEVFLSFRGPDTRHQITDILYRFLIHIKIHTFKDDDELRKGEGIWSNLVKAIDQSKIYIPIISKSYAHSKWCLKELAEIVECQKRDNRRIILPIFYMVDPRDVRHQTGPYQDAFKKHVRSFDEKTVQSWKDALNVVGTLKGWHVRSNEEQGAISDEVSANVWSHLSKYNYVLDTDELIGIDDHIEAVVEKLSIDSKNMTMVGIHGIGGIGKTTIARAIYNQIVSQFDRCCFVENIRETQQQKDGIVIIQEKLTSDILRMDSIRFRNDSEGRKMIKERICRFKTLIILDDVDEKFRFEDVLGSPKNFHHGSRFIITSRNIKVLGSLNENQCRLYEVGAMSQSRSLELFCKHAFKKNYPPPNYNTLVDGIVSTTGGLPLTLKVIGSMLYREELAVWQEKLDQLRGTIEHQVMERLKISYDTLTNEAQQIFLDIACFFIDKNKEMPSYMWSDCNFYPASNINILIQRSMIKLGDNDAFQMHDQLRDMGREIVRQENIEHPWMRSRIWSFEEVKKLIYERKMAERLKVIDLSYCSGFRKLPRFPRSLEILRLSYIEGHEIPELDIGELKKLKVLDIRHSKIQKITGGTFGTLKGLRELDLTNFKCKNLREVMVDVGELSSLKILRTSRKARDVEYETPIGLKVLSTSYRISNLAEMLELEVLKIYDCKFGLEIPPMWWKVSKLKTLWIANTMINGGGSKDNMITTMFPSSLTSLNIIDCRAWLPSLANLGNLTHLLMDDCRTINNHLDGIAGLKSLRYLEIKWVKGLARITGLTSLMSSPDCKLENLAIIKCPDLIELHDDDKAAKVGVVVNSLRLMIIVHCPQLDAGPLVRGLTKFPMLRELWLEKINFIGSIERITSLSKLKEMKQLAVVGAHGLREIEGLGELKCLEYLMLRNCTSLERLWHADDRLENLKSLDIRNCRSLSVEHLSALKTDTRNQITDILYRFLCRTKIHTFKDDNELRKGEEIGSNLLQAIDQSKIYVPIISKNYAHSKWCLIELAEIIRRQEQDTRRIILPIFYMVDPRDVRHQTGPYLNAFQEHGKKFDQKTIQSWKDALNKVGALKGWHVKSNDEQGVVADEVSADLWSRLSTENLTLETGELVGIDDHVEAIVEKLSLDSKCVIVVGLHGMGGIGKTTIAKAVYNNISSRFNRCCFVENVRETQGHEDGVVALQKKLVSEILRMGSIGFTHDSGGRKMIKERVSRFKSLIVFDDVDEKFKFHDVLGSLKDFTSESRFIITSRNERVLSTLGENECRLYEVGSMSQSRSLELFSKHAFKMNSPPPDYKTLANDIVLTTGGLPLTLKVIGSLLYREEIAVWKDKLEQLHETLELEVLDRLKISYDSLAYEAQQIFLDIACFFIGENKEMSSYMWTDCRFYPASNIKILIQRSMIKVGNKDEFQMHDQLRDMGAEIVRREDIERPWMRSRIWSTKDGIELLSNIKELEELDLNYLECSNLREAVADVGQLTSLKILRTAGAKEVEYDCPLGLKELYTSSWISSLAELLELEVLRVYGCEDGLDIPLATSEDQDSVWWKVSKLKYLFLTGTKINNNVSDHGGGGRFLLPTSLISLRIRKCHEPTSLIFPSMENLKNLTRLEVDDVLFQTHLDGLEGLRSLETLFINNVSGLTKIKGLRDLLCSSTCKLESLQISSCLDLNELVTCELDQTVLVPSLQCLSIGPCPHLDVGPVIRGLSKFPTLKKLALIKVMITKEEDLEVIGTLEELDTLELELYPSSLERIPSLSKLKKLESLTLSLPSLRDIEGLGELKSLKELCLQNCESLERLWLEDHHPQLCSLGTLNIRNCKSLSVDHLSALKTSLPPGVAITWPDHFRNQRRGRGRRGRRQL